MTSLLAAVSLPYLRAHGGRILLTVCGIIIGVQGMVAVAALNGSIVRSFEVGADVIAGDAALHIIGSDSGIPESLLPEVQAVAGVEHAVAVIQGSFQTTDQPPERIAVFGLDLVEQAAIRNPQFPREHVHIKHQLSFLNALDSIALGKPLLHRLGMEVGSRIDLATPNGVHTFTIRGSLDPIGPAKLYEGAVALVDLPNAQRLILTEGVVQAIYVTLTPDASVDDMESRLRAVLAGRARVERTSLRGEQVDALLSSLRVALSLASLVTMIVAFFIIYQTMAISVEQRRRDIAIARALGFTRAAVLAVFAVEALALGLVGALGGIVGGYALARLSLRTALAGVSDMYVEVAHTTMSLPVTDTAVAVSLGLATCLLASILPALRAARQPPAAVLRSTAGVHSEALPRGPSLLGTLALGAALVILSTDLRLSNSTEKTAWIMLGHGLLIAGAALFTPLFLTLWARTLLLGRHAMLAFDLAVEFVSRMPRRAAATVSAIMVGYALVVVLGSVVHSITATMRQWLGHTFDADLIVGTSPGLTSPTFDSDLATRLARVSGVRSTERYRKTLYSFDGRPVVLVAFDRANRPDRRPLVIVQSTPGAYDDTKAGQAVFISESFAFRYGHSRGDVLGLDTAVGRKSFRIAAIVRDYTFDLGTIFVDIDVYQHLWRDKRLTYAKIWKSPGADLDSIRREFGRLIANHPHVNMTTNGEFRAEVESRVHNLLQVLNSLQIFACVVAMLSVANLLLASVLDRKREIALLRSVGVTRAQIQRAVVVEAALMGLAGAIFGVITGFVAGFFMVTHSLRVDMGWSLDFSFPTTLALSTLLTMTAAAAAAGYLPARRLTAGTVLAGLQTE